MTRRTADILGGLILAAFWNALSGYPAMAQTECKPPEAWAAPGINLIGFNGPQFVAVMESIATGPAPDAIDLARMVIAYIPADGVSDVRLRFFDAQGCDLGFWTQIPLAALHYINHAMGTQA